AVAGLLLALAWWRSSPGRSARLGGTVLLVALPLTLVFVGNGRAITCGDNTATKWLPVQILRGKVELSSIPEFQPLPLPYAATRIGRRVVPTFPIGTAIVVLPYYALAEIVQTPAPARAA